MVALAVSGCLCIVYILQQIGTGRSAAYEVVAALAGAEGTGDVLAGG